jgi:hypothetical protein
MQVSAVFYTSSYQRIVGMDRTLVTRAANFGREWGFGRNQESPGMGMDSETPVWKISGFLSRAGRKTALRSTHVHK